MCVCSVYIFGVLSFCNVCLYLFCVFMFLFNCNIGFLGVFKFMFNCKSVFLRCNCNCMFCVRLCFCETVTVCMFVLSAIFGIRSFNAIGRFKSPMLTNKL